MINDDTKEVLILFGKKVKDLRLKRNLSLRMLEKECDIDNSYISKIEHGKANISFTTIIELAGALEIHPKELFDFKFDWKRDDFK